MQIIYRVYEKTVEGSNGWFNQNTILQQDVLQCESREHFKEIMKDFYGKDVAFRNSSKLEIGKIFISIISENCYDPETYLRIFKYTCDECNKEFLANGKTTLHFIRTGLIERESPTYFSKIKYEIQGKKFCSSKCSCNYEQRHINNAIKFREETDDVEDIWINKDRFANYGYEGYIYMISKKSTGEFYVGQTKHNPIFRWGQHLLTKRFNIENIEDYIFEILEKVPLKSSNDLTARETFWINKKRNENPLLSLNIIVPREDSRI